DWYFAIGNRKGWDDDLFDPQYAPPGPISIVTHALMGPPQALTSRIANSRFSLGSYGGKYYGCIVCADGDPDGSTEPNALYDFIAGSKALIAHEYQHGVTNFSVADANGIPGVPATINCQAGWAGALHEGLSDTFAGLFSGEWYMGQE